MMNDPVKPVIGTFGNGLLSIHRASRFVAVALVGVALLGCAASPESSFGEVFDFESPVESHKLASRGVAALQDNDPELASQFFNAALKLDIENSYLQLLNGLAYHAHAGRADSTKYSLAEQGYKLAIQFDPNNWLARYFLGRLYLDQRRYDGARASFADAMLYADSDPDLLYYFAVASYYARDPETAAGALYRLQELEPDSPRTMRVSSIVSAAVGDDADAVNWLNRYTQAGSALDAQFVARRVSDWRRIHRQVPGGGSGPSLSTLAALGPADEGSFLSDALGATGREAFAREEVVVAQLENTEDRGDDTYEEENYGEDRSSDEVMSEQDDEASVAEDKMVIVDVVIISSVEDISSAKGVNLLSGLQIQFGNAGTDTPAFGFTRTKEREDGVPSEKTSIVRALTIPTINYSLNIANAGTNRNEILARPSLVAEVGQTSEFFSGENIKASAVSKTAQEGSTEVDQDIGVKLALTPGSIEDDLVSMQIEVERTFLQAPSTSVQFDFQIRTSKTQVSANVVLRRGETLILSGLSEKETESTRDGVPGLQEIPGLQYLISRATTRDFNRSVLVLVTPRAPEYTFRPKGYGPLSGSEGRSDALNELKARYTDWFQPYPNWASVFNHLQKNQLYREFRTGDVKLERWDSQQNRGARLGSILNFLYF